MDHGRFYSHTIEFSFSLMDIRSSKILLTHFNKNTPDAFQHFNQLTLILCV